MSITPLSRARVDDRTAKDGTITGAAPAFVFRFDDEDDPSDVVDVLALAAFVDGRQPFARSTQLDKVRAEAPLLPPGAHVLRTATGLGRRALLATGDGWTVHSVRWRNGSGYVTVTAVTDELARTVLDETVRDAAVPAETTGETVSVGFWHNARGSGQRLVRAIAASPWSRLRSNYAPDAAAALDRLMALTADDVRGRLLLLHGPPGTGKTTALRSLALEWRSWCQLDCVLDPERLFAEPAYLMDVAVGVSTGGERRRWRLLLLEDCDELIRGEARQASGQALSRLLNLTDGMLGQGRDVLVAITTNEPVSRLHPAVVRPGRCLAQIAVGPLPRRQAVAWLGSPTGIGPTGATLAELYALRSGETVVSTAESEPAIGCYL